MKKKDFFEEINKLDEAALYKKACELKEEGLKLRLRNASNQLETPHRIKQNRKQLAAVLTRSSNLRGQEKQ